MMNIQNITGNEMANITQPTKEQVRAYMASRAEINEPVPEVEEIRRQLGWYLVAGNESIIDHDD